MSGNKAANQFEKFETKKILLYLFSVKKEQGSVAYCNQ